MSTRARSIVVSLAGLILLAILILQIPAVNAAVSWRYDKFTIYVRNLVDPPARLPTPLPASPTSTLQTAASVTPAARTPTQDLSATATLEPLPAQVQLPSPPHEFQTPNNCGPATLSMALHMYGWEGSQADIAALIKPQKADRNVNPDEMAWYVRNEAGGYRIEFRVGGTIFLLKRLLAANYPVIIEGTTSLDPNDVIPGVEDDLWAAHYLLLTGYEDATESFIVQDSYHGPDKVVSYSQLESDWKPFNYMYMVIYFPQDEEELKAILGQDWDLDQNRQSTLALAGQAVAADPNDAFAWFNVGSNLVYFERYEEAVQAYNQARTIGLPIRMLRYQFGPYHAYFYTGRFDELLLISEDTLEWAYSSGHEWSEEAWFWKGWALYRQGDARGAMDAWEEALYVQPGYCDAESAISLIQQTDPPAYCVP